MENLEYITKKQTLTALQDAINPIMVEKGFKWVKSKDAFVKKDKEWYLELCLNIINFWPLKQEFNLPVVIVNNKLNELFIKTINVKKNDYLIYKWFMLDDSNELKFKELYTSQDVDNARNATYTLVVEKILPFFETFTQINNILKFYKKDTDSDLYFHRFLKYVILLYISNTREEYNFIKENVKTISTQKFNDDDNLTSNDRYNKLLDVFSFLEKLDEKELNNFNWNFI